MSDQLVLDAEVGGGRCHPPPTMGGRRNQPGSVADLSTAQRMVLDEVTGERTTRQIAMAAGLLSFAARERLEELEHLGLVQRVGLWWGRA